MISIQPLRHIENDSSFAETVWMQNRLYFKDMPFPELLKNLERKYGVSFQLKDSVNYSIHFTGSFQHESIGQVLDALRLTTAETPSDFSYEMHGNQVFIYNKKIAHSMNPK
jgi:ferric-dicitrate binding protein FerR (iron transport regulator)